MREKFRKLGMVDKITVLVVCILLIPIYLFCMFYNHAYKQSLYTEADQNLVEGSKLVGRIMESRRGDIENALTDIAYSQEFLYFFDDKSDLSEREKAVFLLGIQDEWLNLCHAYPNLFIQMNLYTSNNKLEMGFNRNLTIKKLQSFSNLKEANKHEDIWCGEVTALIKDEDESSKLVNSADVILPVYMNVRNLSTQEIIGIVELDIPLEKMIDSNLLAERKAGMVYVFVNRQGEEIYQIGRKENTVRKEIIISQKLLRSKDINKISLRETVYRIKTIHKGDLGINCIVGMEEEKS